MDIGKLLENKLLLQYMAGAGGAMSAGEPIGPALNQITQQNLAAQSQATTNKKTMQMLARLLGKGVDFKSDEKGLITIKGELDKILSGELELGGSDLSGGTQSMREAARMQSTGIKSIEPVGGATGVNPFLLAL